MIARVPFEAFDADQVSLPCESCGLSEYACLCEVESWPAPKLTADEKAHRDARIAEILEAKAERLVEAEPKRLGDGWNRVAA
jgi:hypothetical protein